MTWNEMPKCLILPSALNSSACSYARQIEVVQIQLNYADYDDPAVRVLERNDIPFEYDVLAPKIINRAGTDTCPMKKAVADIDDPEAAYVAIRAALNALNK